MALLFSSCNDNRPTLESDNLFKFKEYISQTTYGNKSVTTPITVELRKPIEPFELTTELPSDYIKISPKTEGTLLLENGRSMIFQPSENLKPDTEYTISVLLHKLYDDLPKEFKTYTFQFKTIAPNFKVDLDNLQSYSKKWQYVTGSISTSDIVSIEKAKQLVRASQHGKTLTINWPQETGAATFFNFKIDSIQRAVEDSEIEISWDGKAIASDLAGDNTFAIPGQNNFKVVDVKSTYAPESALSINFSDPLQENQNFEGLVSVEQAQNLRFEVDGNILHIYPTNRVIGNVRVTLFNGIKNENGFKLKNEFSELISFEQLKPAIQLISKGVILPNAASTPIYFKAVNLSKVEVRVIEIYEDNMLQFLQRSNLNNTSSYDVKRVGRRIAKKTIDLQDKGIGDDGLWKAYGINLSEYFNVSPGSLYRIEISFSKEHSTYTCDGLPSQENSDEPSYYDEDFVADGSTDKDALEEQYWDNEIYNYRRYDYNWEQRDNPCHSAYYNEDRIVSANILGSDLGLIVKKGNNTSYHFAATNLLTTQPQPGTNIKLYNFQQQQIGTVDTDSNGLAIIDSDKNAAFAVAKKGSNFAYVRLEDGKALSLSKFDVSGKTLEKGLKGFIYTERGVYRPGDSIHLTFAFNDAHNPLPKNHPVKLEVTDARGKLVSRSVVNSSVNGFYYFPIATAAAAPTGNWNATIRVGGVSFSKTLKVATIKPNRLKLKLNFQDEILDATQPIIGDIEALWLHGAPARNLKVEVAATIRSTTTAFDGYHGYQFNDPIRSFDQIEVPILDGQLSESGLANFSKNISTNKNAPGMLQATFLTKVFEGGGDFSMDVFSKDLAPYAHFVGLRSPETKRYGSYDTDAKTTFDVATVTAQGSISGQRKLEVQVFKIEWRWWWNRGNDNLSRYENATVHRPVQTFEVTTNNQGKTNFDLTIPNDEGGRYLIRVKDPISGHATGRVAYFYKDWWKRASDGDSESSKMLLFSADKNTYKVGNEAVINFPSSTGGRALVSVENGTEVLTTQWVETKPGETQVRIPISKEMAPNVFVNISLLQPHEQTKNDLPIRLYGVVPILVEDPTTILKPILDMPDELRPEQTFKVSVSEENKKAMTYTIAMVDEGLLDLTRFSTPKIHEEFYSREALGVKTFDIFDYVIGAYSGNVNNIYAIGGGADASGGKNRKADRFKPVVRYLGPFKLKAGAKATHNITMPNYIGSVRTMIIAGDSKNSAYGKSDKTTPVRKPLMVLASLPRKLSPGEKVTLPVTVFAMDKKVKNVAVTVKTGDALKAIDGATKRISFSETGEQIINFEFEVLPATEFQTIEISAVGNGETASYKVEIDVENPNPISQKTTQYSLAANGAQDINFETFGVAGTNGATLEFSTLPPMDFGRRMEYLIQYPHGCIEQTTSSAFPQLYLDDVFDINLNKKKEIESNITAAIKRLGNFQTTNGGLSYWPGERSADPWGTNYAGHFMLEAKQKGYVLPISFLNNWLRYQKDEARQWRNTNTRYNASLEQAYRLYTLALAGQPELAPMNRLRESKNLSNDAKWRLAAAYALAGKPKVGEEIARSANVNFQPRDYDRYTYGSPFRNKAMALETMVALGDAQQRDLAISLAKELSSQRWYSTQETAYGLLAMAKMVGKNGGKALELSFTQNGKVISLNTSKAVAQRELALLMGSNLVTVTNKKGNLVYITLSQKGKLPIGDELAERKNIALKAEYIDRKGNPIDISNVRQGTEIFAKVAVTNSSNDDIDNVALTKIFPSGWEIVNTSFTQLGGGAEGNARYTDIRDDRVNFYFELNAKKTKVFTVQLNASYLGTYYLPGTQVEAMYDANYYARNQGIWITVTQ